MNAQPLNTLAISEFTPSYAVNRTAKSIIEDNDYHISQITAALSAPPRNCDVGTAKEQLERFNEFCQSRYDPEAFDGVIPTGCKCPCQYADGCNQFVWAQMPCEADAQKGGEK